MFIEWNFLIIQKFLRMHIFFQIFTAIILSFSNLSLYTATSLYITRIRVHIPLQWLRCGTNKVMTQIHKGGDPKLFVAPFYICSACIFTNLTPHYHIFSNHVSSNIAELKISVCVCVFAWEKGWEIGHLPKFQYRWASYMNQN